MYGNRSIESGTVKEMQTVTSSEEFYTSVEGSLNSSYADVFESSGVIIRDYEGSSLTSTPFHTTNIVTYNLNKCKSLVVNPYYKLLCLIAWRPFGKGRQHDYLTQCFYNIFNYLYTFLAFCILLFWYVIRVYICEGHLVLGQSLSTKAPTITPTTVSPNASVWNWSNLLPAGRAKNNHTQDAFTDPCQHVFGTYIVPNILHFFAFLIGFYHFRIKEHEGLYALMEKVYLQSNSPGKMTKQLRIYLIAGIVWLCVSMGSLIFNFMAFGFDIPPSISESRLIKNLLSTLIIISGVFSNCVILAVVLSYCGQCQLLTFYINGVAERLEEKTTELIAAMKEILDIKRHFNRLNGLLSLCMSCIVFNLVIVEGLTVIILFNYQKIVLCMLIYRALIAIQWGIMLLFLLVQAAHLTSREKVLKDKVLAIRVFGYRSYTQLDIDSFLNFLNMIELQVHIFTIPVKARYLWGSLIIVIQILIFAFQTGSVIGNSKWI